MKMNLIGKKGQGSNYLAVIIFIFFFGFMNILGYTIWLEILNGLTGTGLLTGVTQAVLDNFTNAFRAFDFVIVIFVVIMILGTGLLSFRIKTRTAYFIVTFIMAFFWGFVSYFFNHIFIQLVSPDVFNTALGFFPRTMVICTNLHWIMVILIIVGSITLYGKKEEELVTLT